MERLKIKAGSDFVAYYRVSTKQQGDTQNGLDAQKARVRSYLDRVGGNLLVEFTEIESATRSKRKRRLVLDAALAKVKSSGAILLVAKLDRLTRDAEYLFHLQNSGVPFLALDCEDCNSLTVGLFAIVAQRESELISERTKAALAAKMARGEKVGFIENFGSEGRKKSLAVRRENAGKKWENTPQWVLAQELRAAGMSYRKIATKLEQVGYHTPGGGEKWHPNSVRQLLGLRKASRDGEKFDFDGGSTNGNQE